MNRNRRSITSALAAVAGGAILGSGVSHAGVTVADRVKRSISGTGKSIHRTYGAKLVNQLQRNHGSAQARLQGYIPDVELVDENNERQYFYRDLVKDKVVLINFTFTYCGDICPLTTANLAEVQKGLGDHMGKDVFMVSITLDPDIDTPEVLKHYASAFGVKPGWSFLTGKFDTIELLRYRLGIYDPDPVIDADKTQHGGLVIYGNEATGKWSATPGMLKPSEIVRSVLRLV